MYAIPSFDKSFLSSGRVQVVVRIAHSEKEDGGCELMDGFPNLEKNFPTTFFSSQLSVFFALFLELLI